MPAKGEVKATFQVEDTLECIKSLHIGPATSGVKRTSAAECGVSLAFLLKVAPLIPDDWTTAQVVTQLVLPATTAYKCRFVEIPCLIPPECVAPPTFFISHKWGGQFSHLVKILREHLSGALPGQVFLWLDIFAVNQHPGAEQADDLRNLKAAIQIASGTLVILDKEGGPLRRVWCLYEFWNTLKVKGPEGLHMLTGGGFSPKDMLGVLGNINVSEADATVASDKERILMDINLDVGITKFNAILKMLFLFNPLDYSSDISALKQHVKTSQWSLAKVHQWMRTPLNMTLGDAAAAAAAARVAPVEVVQKKKIKRYVPPPKPVYRVYRREGAPPWLLEEKRLRMKKVESESSSEPEPEEEAPVEESEEEEESSEEEEETDYETTESEEGSSDDDDDDDSDSDNERKRLRMRRARPGIAAAQNKRNAIQAQSANHLPEVTIVGSRVLAIYGSPGSGKTTLAVALCQEPGLVQAYHMCKHNDVRRQDIIKVLMSLAYQLGTCNELTELRDEYTSALSSDDAQRLVQPDDPNEIFEILLKRPLNKLQAERAAAGKAEPRVTILLDGLDEADGQFSGLDNRLLQFLRDHFATLPNWVRFIVTSRPRPHIKASLKYKYHAVELVPGHLRLTTDLQKQLGNRLVGLVHTDAVDAVAGLLVEQSNGSMVYLTVAIELLKRRKKALQSSAVGAVSAARAMANAQAIASEFPTSLADGYRQLFRQDLAKLSRDDTTRVMKLLEVLVAAREPLTLNQLQSLGKKDHLVLLPGWGWLFYEKDYQVHAMHKSIFDWLRNKDAAGEFFVDAVLGHVAIADLVCRDVRSSKHPQNYSVKYAVAHLCMAGDTTALEKLVLDFHFWQRAYTVGCGVDVFRDLLELAPSGSAAAQDVLRWLSDVSEFLMKHPQATIQLAQDAPTESLTSKAGVFLNWRRGAVLLNKDQGWPSCLTALRGHAMLVSSTAFSPTGNLVASSSYDGSVRLWDPRTGQQVTALIGHMGEVTDVVISPDGMKVVTVGRDYTARYWDIKTGHQMEVWGLPVASAAAVGDDLGVTCLQLTVSPDCSTVASLLSDRTVRLWDIRTSKQLSMREGHSVVAFSPDGVALATGSSDTDVLVWEAKTRRHLAVLKCETPVTAVTLGQACRYAATGSPRGDVLLWDVRAGGVKMASLQGHSSQVSSLALSPDGNLLASGAKDRTVLLWEARTGQRVDTVLHGHSGPVSCLCFSPDSKLLTSGSADSTVRLWDAAIAAGTAARKISTGVPTLARRASLIMANASDAASKTAPVYVRSATFSPNGGSLLLIVSLDKSAQIWDTKTATCICRLDGSTQSTGRYQFSPDGSLVLAPLMPQITLLDELEEAWIWDTKTGRLMAQLQGKQPTFSPHSSMVACVIPAGTDGKLSAVRICEARSGDQVSILEGHTPSFSPDGARIATVASAASVEGDSIRLWNTDKFEELAVIHGRGPVVWSSDGALLALKYKNTTVLRGSNKGQRIGDLRGLMPQGGQPFFSPDSSRCVTLDSDWTVYIWDSYQGTQIVAVKRSVPSHITFSHDGMRAVISSCERPGSVRAGSNSSSALPAAPGSPKSVSSPHRSMSIFNHSNSLSLHASNSFHGGVLSSSSFLNASLGASLGGSLSVEGTRGASFVGSGHISLAALLNAQHAARKEPDNEVQLWDTESGNLLAKFETTGFAFSPDGTLLAAAVCPSNQNGRSSFSGHSFMLPNRLGAGPGSGSSLQASSSMQLPDAAPTPAVSKVVMYDARTGRQTLQLASIPNMGPCQRLRFSEDGMYLAGVSDDQLVAVWNSQLGTEVKWSGSASSCSIADWSPPYFVAVGGDTEVIKLMNASKPWTWDDATAIFSTTPVGKVVIQGCMAVTAGSTTQTPPGSALQDLALYDNVHMWRINTTGS
uniref:NACHT domain-containing protein n=1 Tax=Chlamydomonas chlamydogama TaxID=225041 RepID=A0A7S2QU83_9CHLO|mmetsp:Transcript_528/g.1137  ORF Transcript_528/g.1137 Transcript_528/m.1137 type:complete len:1889 (+) Transcript_528:279-5945(+)